MSKMIKSNSGYDYQPCKHGLDPLQCERCDLFKEGYYVVDESTLWDKLRHPIGYLKVRNQIKELYKNSKPPKEIE